jgi:hypothetical protein
MEIEHPFYRSPNLQERASDTFITVPFTWFGHKSDSDAIGSDRIILRVTALQSGGIFEEVIGAEMAPINTHFLDESIKKENITIILGKDVFLQIFEDAHKSEILKREPARELLKIDNLSHKEIQKPLEKIDELLNEESILIDNFFPKAITSLIQSWAVKGNRTTVKDQVSDPVKENDAEFQRISFDLPLEKKLLLNLNDVLKADALGFKVQLIEMDKNILLQESILRKINPQLKLLDSTSILMCPKCHVPLFEKIPESENNDEQVIKNQTIPPGSKKATPAIVLKLTGDISRLNIIQGEFKDAKKCIICNEEISIHNAEIIPLHEKNLNISEVMKDNLWLEEYMATILRDLGWTTWTSVQVHGTSGIPHQVDVLAVNKNGFVLCVECKNRDTMPRKDVMMFAQKRFDIGSHYGLIALTGEFPEPGTKDIVHKNPALYSITNMYEKTKEEIIQEIKNSPLGDI